MNQQLREKSAANAVDRSPKDTSVAANLLSEPLDTFEHHVDRYSKLKSRLALAGLVALTLAICGLAGMGSQSVFPTFLLASSCLVAVAALFLALVHNTGRLVSNPSRLQLVSSKLERRIEELEDLRWQARDDASHLKALLDAQSAIIIKRDGDGRITFANRAFCAAFGMKLETVLNEPFDPKVLKTGQASPTRVGVGERMSGWMQPSVQLVATAYGERWIEWTHRRLGDAEDSYTGVQSIGRDITDQLRHELELSRARDEARAADRAKSRFLASMSHEIRTPMNGILGMAGLLGDTEQSAEQKTYVQAVRKSAVALLALIDEILDFSKIEAGHIELANDPVDIVDCVQGAVELLAPRAYQKQLQLVWSTAPDMPRQFFGDEARIRQILLNLLGNAVKFTETGGISVWVGAQSATEQMDEIKIVVRDTGPGLSKEAKARIFMEFERAVPEGVIQESGTGLGLAIAQRLAQSMGGGITVTSVLGSGATFSLSVRLPRAPQKTASMPREFTGHRHIAIVSPEQIERRTIANFLRAHDMAVTEFAQLDDLLAWQADALEVPPDTVLLDCNVDPHAAQTMLNRLSDEADIQAAVIAATGDRAEFERFNAAGIESFLVRPIRPATLLALLAGEVDKPVAVDAMKNEVEPESDSGIGHRVLVAEDNEINALLARTVLTKLGCVPVVVANGREAIDEVRRSLSGKTPALDAILMDLHMPEVDGLQATAEIHQICEDAGRARPAIIAVTANAFQEDRETCISAGMDDYLSKPFEPGDLRRVLDRIAPSSDKERG